MIYDDLHAFRISRDEWIILRCHSHIIIHQAHKYRVVDIKEGVKI